MFLLIAIYSATVASARFQGAKVDLLFDKSGSEFSLRATRHGVVERVEVGSAGEDLAGEPLLREASLRVEAVGVKGRGYLVAAVPMDSNSGGVEGTAYVFDWVGGKLKKIGELESNQMFTFPMIAPGRRVIASSHEIGQRMGHSGMPRWQEFYVIKDSRLTPVTHSVRLYRPWMADLWKTLLQYPDDASCWHYYGIAAERSGSGVRPRDAYRHMLAARRRWDLGGSEDADGAVSWLKAEEKSGRWPTEKPD